MANNKQHYFYVLHCADDSFYAGYTTDPERREKEHNNGIGSKYTKTRRPVKMIHEQGFETRSEATKAEYAFKQLTRRQKEIRLKKWKKEIPDD
ncbi:MULTISPECIES: GIY-YIG nuclease family protein [unclassified Jeotgalibaca]|uniref:GIY-YIG nuclease family protein n=1 Tax=unclassified Jeotgalibaca TaxID=2621505 RepID=UPI003FCF3AA4